MSDTAAEYYAQIGKKIKEIRETAKLSQKHVAKELGITFQQLQKYENGSNRIPLFALTKICDLFKINVQNLIAINESEYETLETLGEEKIKLALQELAKPLVYNTYHNNITNNNYYGLFPNFMSKSIDINLENMKNKSIYILILICSLVFLSMSYLKFFPMDASAHTKITNYQVLALMVIILTLVTLYVRSKALLFLLSFIAFSSFVFAGYVGIWGTFFHLENRLQIRISLYVVAFIFALSYTLALKRFQLRNTK